MAATIPEEESSPEAERLARPAVRLWKVAVPETFRAVVEAVTAVIIVVEA